MRDVHGPQWSHGSEQLPLAPAAVATFFCDTCGRSYALAGREGHLAGLKHARRAAQTATDAAAAAAGGVQNGEAAIPAAAVPTAGMQRGEEPVRVGTGEEPAAKGVEEEEGWESQFVTVTGERFHCRVCGRETHLKSLVHHVRGKKHKMNVRLEKERVLAGAQGWV